MAQNTLQETQEHVLRLIRNKNSLLDPKDVSIIDEGEISGFIDGKCGEMKEAFISQHKYLLSLIKTELDWKAHYFALKAEIDILNNTCLRQNKENLDVFSGKIDALLSISSDTEEKLSPRFRKPPIHTSSYTDSKCDERKRKKSILDSLTKSNRRLSFGIYEE